jgi:putative pyruvate formate lyase activating enzyme
MLDGLIDIYLPDLKYYSSELSSSYSHAADYFDCAKAAIAEMFRQVGTPVFDTSSGLMKRGMIVRHLVLPGQTRDSKKILRYLHETYGDRIYISIMNQYTPLPHVANIPELSRRVTEDEYHRVLKFAEQIGIENGFYQEGETSLESFIPPFHFEGILSND